jgi:hypothetical protein
MAEFPEPKSLNKLEIGDGMVEKNFGKYSLENPHPGYGKDPNIINEYGHSIYPKWIYPNGKDQPGVIVNDATEEARHYKPEEVLKEDGPTITEFIAAGYKASQYPPKGYAAKSSQEEINAEIEKEKAAVKPDPWG